MLDTEVPTHKFNKILYYAAAAFVSSILLFDLYNRNRMEGQIAFNHMLILGGVLSIVGLIIFLAFKHFTKTMEGALLLSILFWMGFWMFEFLFSVALQLSTMITHSGFMFMLVTVLFGIAVLIRRYKTIFFSIRPGFTVLAVCAILLFAFNFFPGISNELGLRQARTEFIMLEEGAEPFYIKRNFIIDPALPSPDIYWFHVDGLMALETVEAFWGEDSLDSLREEFASRGFLIYEDAFLNAVDTRTSLTALLSPAFYDSFWGEQLSQNEMGFRTYRRDALRDSLTHAGIDFQDDIVPYYELFTALTTAGYDISFRSRIGRVGEILPSGFAHLTGIYGYSYNLGPLHRLIRRTGDLAELLSLTTPFNFPALMERVDIDTNQLEGTDTETPRFTWQTFMNAHMSFIHNVVPGADTRSIEAYPQVHRYVARQALNAIDDILQVNPDAVIVVQADHGLHLIATQRLLIDRGYTFDDVHWLAHSVFSAVRIPPAYGGLEAPLAPKNISRELVNRFVGYNYTLLP